MSITCGEKGSVSGFPGTIICRIRLGEVPPVSWFGSRYPLSACWFGSRYPLTGFFSWVVVSPVCSFGSRYPLAVKCGLWLTPDCSMRVVVNPWLFDVVAIPWRYVFAPLPNWASNLPIFQVWETREKRRPKSAKSRRDPRKTVLPVPAMIIESPRTRGRLKGNQRNRLPQKPPRSLDATGLSSPPCSLPYLYLGSVVDSTLRLRPPPTQAW